MTVFHHLGTDCVVLADADSRPTSRDWFVVFACLVCQVGMGVGGYIFPVFLKPVVADLGWSRAEYAFANPIMSTAVALAGPLVGWAADRNGPRSVLVLGSVGMSAALFAAGRMHTLFDFYCVALLIGLSVACLGDLPTATAVSRRFRKGRGLALGIVYVGSNIGGTIVPLLGTALAATASWRHAFTTIGAGLWVLLLPFALGVSRPAAPTASETPGLDAGEEDGDSASVAIRQRDFWLLFGVLFAFYFYRLGVNVHLVAYLSDLGYSSLEAASGFSLALMLGIAGKLVAGAFADRVGARAAAIGNFVLLALSAALLLAPHVAGGVPVFLALHGFATAAEDVVIPLLVGHRFGTKNLGRIYGILMLALVPGGAIGPVLAGHVFDATGSYRSVFVLFLVGNLLAVAALLAVRPRPGGAATGEPGSVPGD